MRRFPFFFSMKIPFFVSPSDPLLYRVETWMNRIKIKTFLNVPFLADKSCCQSKSCDSMWPNARKERKSFYCGKSSHFGTRGGVSNYRQTGPWKKNKCKQTSLLILIGKYLKKMLINKNSRETPLTALCVLQYNRHFFFILCDIEKSKFNVKGLETCCSGAP